MNNNTIFYCSYSYSHIYVYVDDVYINYIYINKYRIKRCAIILFCNTSCSYKYIQCLHMWAMFISNCILLQPFIRRIQ